MYSYAYVCMYLYVRVCMVFFRVSERVCPGLEIPENAQVDGDCSPVPSVGDSCTLSCSLGSVQSTGSLTRTCLYDITWSGTPLVCNRKWNILVREICRFGANKILLMSMSTGPMHSHYRVVVPCRVS